MEKWRCIFLTGAILGNLFALIDFAVGGIPYEIVIPIQMVSMILIFTGFIIRKSKETIETQNRSKL